MDILEVDTEQLPTLITDILVAGLVPHIQSSPGIGKSDIIRQIAKEYGLKVIDLRLSQMDSVDMQGFPNIVNNKTDWIPPAVFPLEDDPIPEGYNGFMLFLDEITSAPISVQSSAYKLILDRMVGQHKLHEKVAMVAAGNLLTDKAIVNRMGTAMQSRMIHLKLTVNPEKWVKWAESNNIDYRVTSFIQFRPELLHKFNPNHDDVTFPCP